VHTRGSLLPRSLKGVSAHRKKRKEKLSKKSIAKKTCDSFFPNQRQRHHSSSYASQITQKKDKNFHHQYGQSHKEWELHLRGSETAMGRRNG